MLEPDVDQPHLGVPEDIGGDQAYRVVTPLDHEYRELRGAHRFQHSTLIRLRLEFGRFPIALDCAGTIGRRRTPSFSSGSNAVW